MLVAHDGRRCPTCGTIAPGEALFCPEDGTALVSEQAAEADLAQVAASPQVELVGEVLDGRYQVEERLGAGGMGVVYRASHVELGRRFAVKVLKKEFGTDQEAVERLAREARATSSLGHPNIVNVVDFGALADGSPYFVMEYLEGETLTSRMAREGALPLEVALDIAEQVAEALQAAHRLGIVHRDLKPDNVFLVPSAEGVRVKLLDFGVAKVLGAARKLTRTGIVFGTPQYMSPEQAAGQAVDHRADIYALGLVLYEMLTGRVPFQGDTFMGVLSQHMFDPPAPPSQVLGRPLGPVEHVVLRALEKNPDARHPDVAELLRDLRAVRDGTYQAPDEEDDAGATRAFASRPMPDPATRSLQAVGPDTAADPDSDRAWNETAPPSEATLAAIPGLGGRRTRGPLLALGAAVVVFLVGGVALLLWQRRHDEPQSARRLVVESLEVRRDARDAQGSAQGGDSDGPEPSATATTPKPPKPAADTPAAPSAGAEQRTVELTSIPSGAEVSEGEAILGNTPLKVRVRPGQRRTLRISASGFAPREVVLSSRSQPHLEVRLQRSAPGTRRKPGGQVRPVRRTPAEVSEIVDPWLPQ